MYDLEGEIGMVQSEKLGMIQGEVRTGSRRKLDTVQGMFTKIIKRFFKRGYDPNVLRHTACFVYCYMF